MTHYIGIDLGTTNSAICTFDGQTTHIRKSPEQADVTPSAIYLDRHGHRFYGRRAYEMAPADEKNAATLFKRYLGTSMKYTLAASGETLTPEDCSAEILRLLFSYLPEEWRSGGETATVITVPAAFNQMKKDATLQAAEAAGIGRVALMQEPVAAVMSAMKEERMDGIFLIYDLGGGTFDISVAEYAGGSVNLLAQGGKEMCGGRDWDRMILRQAVIPWLQEHFHLPKDLDQNREYRRLRQLALFAGEQAKIELSLQEEAYIQMDESRIAQKDLDGNEIYLDIRITQAQLTALIEDFLLTTVDVTRETIRMAGVQSAAVRKIVFIGGPTMYPPLQHFVMDALHIREKGSANPMTAVAEGASIFAESIDWSSPEHRRLEAYRNLTEKDFEIHYEQRVSENTARIGILRKDGEAFSAEITSEEDGWSSGKAGFTGRGILSVPLRNMGENRFRVSLFDAEGRNVPLSGGRIAIRQVLASVNAIPSSHAIALKVLDRIGGHPVPVYLVQENEKLPRRGTVTLRAGRRLVAGSSEALVFTLWEGEIRDPVDDNRYIGTYRITGDSFSSGVIAQGAEILCEYEMSESGNLVLGVAVPSVGAVFANRNFYSRKEGQLDLADPSDLLQSANLLTNRILQLQAHITGGELGSLFARLGEIRRELQSEDPETVQQAADDLLDCQRKLARFRQDHLHDVQLIDLRGLSGIVDKYRSELNAGDLELLDRLYDEARRSIEHGDGQYEEILAQYRNLSFRALENSGTFLQEQFQIRVSRPDRYTDAAKFSQLKAEGQTCIENGEFGRLRMVIAKLNAIEKPEARKLETENMFETVNVVRG